MCDLKTLFLLACFCALCSCACAQSTVESRLEARLELITQEYFAGYRSGDEKSFRETALRQYTEILNELCRTEPLFNYLFYSPEFRRQKGAILKKVVWGGLSFRNTSSETAPLGGRSIFASHSRAPILIKLKPSAFSSLAFLKSVLAHELNHACMYKDERFSDIGRFMGTETGARTDFKRHVLKFLDPQSQTYQIYLIHEYYSFKAQLAYDDRQRLSGLPLSEADRANAQSMMEWMYGQMNETNKAFVQLHPQPSLVRWMNAVVAKGVQ